MIANSCGGDVPEDMKSQRVYFDLADTTDDRFDPMVESLLVAVLVFSPLALGAVQPWSEAIVVALCVLMILGLMLKLVYRPDVRFVWTGAYLPMLAFVGLVVFQLLPLPAGVVRVLSPGTYSMRHELLGALPDAEDQLRWMTISFYPEGTGWQLRMLLCGCAVFVVTLNVLRRLRQIKRVLWAVAIVGSAVALLALAQNVTDATKIYWFIPIASNEARSGSFVNHGNFAQFMNMSMGAALALLLLHLDQLPRHRRHESSTAAAMARPVTWQVRLLACGIVAMAVSVPLSLSRGGMLSMLLAGGFTAIVMATRRGMKGRTWLFIAMALAIFGALLLIEWDAVFHRATSPGDPHSIVGRMAILRGSWEIAARFGIWGTGLGTFEFVFPAFDPSTIVNTAEYAENEYAQLLVETGWIGLALAISFFVLVWIGYARCVRAAPSPMASAAIGLGFGLSAVTVHSAADFGQHLPANFVLTAIVSALLLTLSHASRHAHESASLSAARAPRWRRVAGLTAVLVIGSWLILVALQTWRADRYFRAARRAQTMLANQDWRGSDFEFARLIDLVESASRIRPGNVVFHYDLNLYRKRALERNLNPRADGPALPQPDMQHAHRVVAELLSGIWRCPFYAPPYLLAGQIQRWWLDISDGQSLIQIGSRLATNNPDACIAMGVLDAHQNRWEPALAQFRKALRLRQEYRADVINIVAVQLNRADLALELAHNDMESLRELIRVLQSMKQARSTQELAESRLRQIVMDRASHPEADPRTLIEAARLCVQQDSLERAIAFYRRALSAEYEKSDWRLELATLLQRVDRNEEALNEARTVLRLSPGNRSAAKLLEALSRQETTHSSTAPSSAPAPGFRFD